MPYSINGQGQNFAEPMERDGFTYVPLAGPVETMGGYVTWNNLDKIASIELGADKLEVQEDNPQVTKNSETFELPAAPLVENNKMFVPLEFFQNVLNLQVVSNGSAVAIDQPSA